MKTVRLTEAELYLLDAALEKHEDLCLTVVASVRSRKKTLTTEQRKKLGRRYARQAGRCTALRAKLTEAP